MASPLDKLKAAREALQAQKTVSTSGPSELFPHWKLDFGQSASVRFLPDGDETNLFFWKKKMMWNWTFPMEGGGEKRVVMPCKKMFDAKATCEAYNLLSEMFDTAKKTDDEDLRKAASKYWVDTSFIYHGFVRSSDFIEEEKPDSLIRKFDIIKKTHYDQIESRVMDNNPDTALTAWPVEFDEGLNFIFKKTKNGEYASYANSMFSNNPTPLSDEEVQAIEDVGGVPPLTKYLPDVPTEEQYVLQVEMLQAALDGQVWNAEWDSVWTAYENNTSKDDTETTPAPVATKTKVKTEKVETVKEEQEDTVTEMPEASEKPAEDKKMSKADEIRAKLAAKRAAAS